MMMEIGRPILALAHIKEFEGVGLDMKEEVDAFAQLYCAESDRAVETELSPPPLPAMFSTEEWDKDLDREGLRRRTEHRRLLL